MIYLLDIIMAIALGLATVATLGLAISCADRLTRKLFKIDIEKLLFFCFVAAVLAMFCFIVGYSVLIMFGVTLFE